MMTEYEKCIKACRLCFLDCQKCAVQMAGKESGNDCPNCCLQCLDACLLCIKFLFAGSQFSKAYCLLCAEVCDWCAQQCQVHDHDHCKVCAASCVICADACRAYAA